MLALEVDLLFTFEGTTRKVKVIHKRRSSDVTNVKMYRRIVCLLLFSEVSLKNPLRNFLSGAHMLLITQIYT